MAEVAGVDGVGGREVETVHDGGEVERWRRWRGGEVERLRGEGGGGEVERLERWRRRQRRGGGEVERLRGGDGGDGAVQWWRGGGGGEVDAAAERWMQRRLGLEEWGMGAVWFGWGDRAWRLNRPALEYAEQSGCTGAGQSGLEELIRPVPRTVRHVHRQTVRCSKKLKISKKCSNE
jgi:hypothetical protein